MKPGMCSPLAGSAAGCAEVHGVEEGTTISNDPIHELSPWRPGTVLSRARAARSGIAAIIAVPGAIAESRATGASAALLGEDAAWLFDALRILPPESRSRARVLGYRRAEALVTSGPGERFIAALARRLERDGAVSGAVCRDTFRRSFGQPPPELASLARAKAAKFGPAVLRMAPAPNTASRKGPGFLVKKAA